MWFLFVILEELFSDEEEEKFLSNFLEIEGDYCNLIIKIIDILFCVRLLFNVFYLFILDGLKKEVFVEDYIDFYFDILFFYMLFLFKILLLINNVLNDVDKWMYKVILMEY